MVLNLFYLWLIIINFIVKKSLKIKKKFRIYFIHNSYVYTCPMFVLHTTLMSLRAYKIPICQVMYACIRKIL